VKTGNTASHIRSKIAEVDAEFSGTRDRLAEAKQALEVIQE